MAPAQDDNVQADINLTRTESEKHFTRRLEAFSDIVIGFSLAQLGAALVVSEDGFRHFLTPLGLLNFLLPFAIVCSAWFFHHRLFSQLFIPRTWPVILNFAWLASVVLAVFGAEAYTKLRSLPAMRFYFACYAVVYGLLTVQYLIALRYASTRQSAAARLRAVRGATFMGLWTLPCLFALAIVLIFEPGAMYILISLGFAAAAPVSSMLRKRFDAAEARVRAA